MERDLTTAELELLQRLPGPPATAHIHVTNVWIVEWLPDGEQRTGSLLHEWMKERRPGWSAYSLCKTKQDVLSAIEYDTNLARQSGMVPVLHLEAHGYDDRGLAGPDGSGGTELLSWDELTEPLQTLNLVTHCNLIVFVAACTGFAGINVFYKGPRAPAVALVGPDAIVSADKLLAGTKEFYRRCQDESPNLGGMASSASQQAGSVTFEMEPFAILAYEAMAQQLIVSMRLGEQCMRVDRIRQKMITENKYSAAEIDRRLTLMPQSPCASKLQGMWNKMFMIDLYPENIERFSVDMTAIVELVVGKSLR
ncbi:MAG: hypothetical protein ACOH2K_13365 [Burkholderiaceae bacterium]